MFSYTNTQTANTDTCTVAVSVASDDPVVSTRFVVTLGLQPAGNGGNEGGRSSVAGRFYAAKRCLALPAVSVAVAHWPLASILAWPLSVRGAGRAFIFLKGFSGDRFIASARYPGPAEIAQQTQPIKSHEENTPRTRSHVRPHHLVACRR